MRIIFGFITILILASFSNYKITKDDFVKQVSDSAVDRLYCINSKGDKVWITNLQNSILKIQLKDNSVKNIEYRLQSIKIIKDSIIGELLNSPNKLKQINLNDIESLMIICDSHNEIAYFNLDSCKSLLKLKNDSLNISCHKSNEIVIYLEPKMKEVPILDSISIYENACYNIDFNDNVKINHGVIQKITMDSIFITNTFNLNTAKHENINYKVLRYSIKDISQIRVMKKNGLTFTKLNPEKYDFVPIIINSDKLLCPCWFELDEFTGEIIFYREWLLSTGYFGVTEKNGLIYY